MFTGVFCGIFGVMRDGESDSREAFLWEFRVSPLFCLDVCRFIERE